ncbi:hypothetical protein EYC84_006795 [Monilinia fructicola]|nr:hypothetical protein EYC84_006795 [Monilinia fructicola]
MIADICRESGVACLMNGDVENRDQALKLAEEYGTNGGMIAVAAEANSNSENTKYLLGHLVPGKASVYRAIQQSKNYKQLCEHLDHKTLIGQAIEVDEKIGISDKQVEAHKLRQAQAKAEAKAAKKKRKNTENDGGEQKKSRSLESLTQSSTSTEMEATPLTELKSEMTIGA